MSSVGSRDNVLAWLPSKLGVLDTLVVPSTSCPSLCPRKVTRPSLASTVKDENPTSAQAVPSALAHPFPCRGFQQLLLGSSAMGWGSGVLAGSRAGLCHWYQQLHRDGILHPCPPLGSLPPHCWVAAGGGCAALMVAGATVRMLYLTWHTREQGKGATCPPYQALPWYVGVSVPQESLLLAPCHT